jgi:hypothetical protein
MAASKVQGTLLAERSRWLSKEFGKPDQVVRGATEDKQPILLQSAQFNLPERPSLFQLPKALFDQPAAAQIDGVTRLPRSTVPFAAAVVVVLRDMGMSRSAPVRCARSLHCHTPCRRPQ